MFKLEVSPERVYTSVFYDNIRYGNASGTNAYFVGRAYYNAQNTQKIHIDSNNNQLNLEYDGNKISVTIPPNDYVINNSSDANNLTKVLNDELTKYGINVTTDWTSSYETGSYATYYYLQMTSQSTGSGLEIKFDTTTSTAYDALFVKTNYKYEKEPLYDNGSTVQITGYANLQGAITIPNGANVLSISVNKDPAFTLTIPAGKYNSLGDLITELNNQLPADQKGKIQFDSSGSSLVIKGVAGDVTDNQSL